MTYVEPSEADKAAWSAVYECGWLTDSAHNNAIIWRCVIAALDAYKSATP